MGGPDDYAKRIARVADYIAANLDGDLSLDRLADVACFSRFHFQRIYCAQTGESVTTTVQRLRLHRAAGQVARSGRPLQAVARGAGYGSQAAFTRSFRDYFGETPGRLRARSVHLTETADMTDIDIRTIEPIRCAAILHRGPYMEIGSAYGRLGAWAAGAGLPRGGRVLAIPYDDPNTVAPADLRAHACLVVGPDTAIGAPAEEVTIAGGRYAVFRHVGPYSDLYRTYTVIFRDLLPKEGLEPADRPSFEDYVNDQRSTPPSALITDIYIPLP